MIYRKITDANELNIGTLYKVSHKLKNNPPFIYAVLLETMGNIEKNPGYMARCKLLFDKEIQNFYIADLLFQEMIDDQ